MFIKLLREHDGLNSDERKRKYSGWRLKQMAKKAKRTFLKEGWHIATESDIPGFKTGDKIRCCSWRCGCGGQEESVTSYLGIGHGGHTMSFAYKHLNKFAVGSNGEILIRG